MELEIGDREHLIERLREIAPLALVLTLIVLLLLLCWLNVGRGTRPVVLAYPESTGRIFNLAEPIALDAKAQPVIHPRVEPIVDATGIQIVGLRCIVETYPIGLTRTSDRSVGLRGRGH